MEAYLDKLFEHLIKQQEADPQPKVFYVVENPDTSWRDRVLEAVEKEPD